MKPGPFTYHDPATVDDLVGLLGTLEDVKLLAGGQSLMPMLNMRFVLPDHVVDLNGVAGLAGIEDDGGALHIGAMTRQRTLATDHVVAKRCPIMAEALEYVGHFQTRTRGTIGGSLCHLDPAAELPAIAAAYDAVLTVAGPDGEREVPVAEWPLAYMTPNLGADEVLTGLRLPYWDGKHGYAFEEFARRHGDFAIVAVACLLAVGRKGTIERAALALAGVDTAPVRLTEAEDGLVGQPPGDEAFRAAGAIARKIDAMSDAYVGKAYRQRLADVLVQRALVRTAARAQGG